MTIKQKENKIELTNGRNYGIDLLRMVLMFMVVMLHTLGNGGILNHVQLHSPNYFLAWTMECLCFCAVNCYALISGYVGYGRPYRFRSLIMIWVQTIVYTTIVSALFLTVGNQEFSIGYFVNAFFAPQGNPLWYVPVYTGVYILLPALNKTVESFTKHQAKLFLVVTSLALTVIPLLVRKDIFSLHEGYSVFWISYLYLIGAIIRKHKLDKLISRSFVKIIYLISVLLIIGSKFGIGLITYSCLGEVRFDSILIRYTSIVMLVQSIALLLLFVNLDIKPQFSKMIKTLSPAAFGVYLLHCQPYFFSFCTNRFAFLADASPFGMMFGAIGITLLIYILCMTTDLFRINLFRKLNIADLVSRFEDRYLSWSKIFD